MSDEELEKFPKELTSILQYVDMLKEVDTKNVHTEMSITGLSNRFREDEVRQGGATTDELLATSPLAITEQQLQTPAAHG